LVNFSLLYTVKTSSAFVSHMTR